MAVPTQTDIANQMIQQLRILDPSVSAALGTPERKIIDTVAQALADAQLDLSVLSGSLNLDSKFGADLDAFLSLFKFARQIGTASQGVVTVSRLEASNFDIRIPLGTQFAASATLDTSVLQGLNVTFQTTSDVVLSAGETSVSVPIRASQIGSLYNVATNTITSFVGTSVAGITDVTNPVPTIGGSDAESDAVLKVRFKNTLFRNLAGTLDQYLALAVAGAFTNKANVIGPISRYREYIEIPPVDDNTAYDVNDDGTPEAGAGSANQYTTGLSTVPYSAHVYTDQPSFIATGEGVGAIFYTEGIDFVINTDSDRDKGDAHRLATVGRGPALADAANQPNVTFLNVYTGADDSVNAARPGDIVLFEHSYLSSESRNSYENNINNCVDVFINGSNDTPATTVIPRPTAGANLFVNNTSHRLHFDNYRRLGSPDARPLLGNIFTSLYWNPLESLPDFIQVDNNTYFQGTHYWPVIDVSSNGGTVRARTGIEWSTDAKSQATGDGTFYTGPRITATDPDTATSISIENYTFDKNVYDLQSALEGSKQVTTDVLVHKATTRYFKFNINAMYAAGGSRAAINAATSAALNSWLQSLYFGNTIQLSDILQQIHNTSGIDNVRWTHDVDESIDRVIETDANGVPRLGAIVDRVTTGSVTPGVIETQQWYLTGDPTAGTYDITHDGLTATVNFNATAGTIQSAIRTAFGDTNLLVTGTGTPTDPFRLTWALANEIQTVTLTGTGLGGTFKLSFEDEQTGTIAYNASAATLQSALEALANIVPGDVSVSGSAGGPYTVTFAGAYLNTNVEPLVADTAGLTGTDPAISVATTAQGSYGPRTLIKITPSFSGGFNEDFTLNDNELPALPIGTTSGDTVAGLIIRPRAQNTWTKG